MEFQETASPVTCITFHPSDFLLAAGRNDGTVDLYDLETKKLISRSDGNGHTVKCITFGLVNVLNLNSFHPTMENMIQFSLISILCSKSNFSENGECCFVGSAEGVSVIGWEPDREFDHIESAWSMLGDMKVVKQKLVCEIDKKKDFVAKWMPLKIAVLYYRSVVLMKNNRLWCMQSIWIM